MKRLLPLLIRNSWKVFVNIVLVSLIVTFLSHYLGSASISPDSNSIEYDYSNFDSDNNTDSFTYTISDGQGGEATATINIEVSCVYGCGATTAAISGNLE